MSKDSAIYGIFGDEDSTWKERQRKRQRENDMSEESNSMGAISSEEEEKKASVSFVSGNNTKAPMEVDDDTPSVTPMSFSASSTFVSSSTTTSITTTTTSTTTAPITEDKNEEPTVNLYKPTKKRLKSANAQSNYVPEAAFEKHTKGIGSKLLAKMGFTGGGLGKEGNEGIARPIEVKARPRGMGLGFKGFAELTEQQKEDFMPDEDKSDEERDAQQRLKQQQQEEEESRPKDLWKKSKKRPKKTQYVVAEGVAGGVEKGGVAPTAGVIVDMRGATTTLLTDLKQQGTQRLSHGGAYMDYQSELQQNMRMLVDMAVVELHQVVARSRQQQHLGSKLDDEKVVLVQRLEKEQAQVQRVQTLLNELDELPKRLRRQQCTVEQCAHKATELRSQYRKEWKLFELDHGVCEFAEMPLRRLFDTLDVHKCVKNGFHAHEAVVALLAWQKALTNTRGVVSEAYEKLVRKAVLRRLRVFLTNEWRVTKRSEAIAVFVSEITKIVPRGVADVVLEQLVLPKLMLLIDKWKPQTDKFELHEVLEPWMHVLHSNAPDVRAKLRNRVSALLNGWDALDNSARVLLDKWDAVLDNASLRNVFVRSIMPRVSTAMKTFEIDPQNQSMDVFTAFSSWFHYTHADVGVIVEVLEKYFFVPFWRVLDEWLQSDAHNSSDIRQWYINWKQLFPEEALLKRSPRLRVLFNHALHLIQFHKGKLAKAPRKIRFHTAAQLQAEQKREHKQQRHVAQPDLAVQGGEVSYKDVLEDVALSNNIVFTQTSKQHHGKAVYAFGNTHVYVERDVLYAKHTTTGTGSATKKKHTWVATTVEELLKQQQ